MQDNLPSVLVVVCYLCCGEPDPRCPRCADTGMDPGGAK